MPTYEFIGRSRLARGLSFPLNRSEIDEFLDHHGIDFVTGLAFCGLSEEQGVLSAEYWCARKRGMSHTLTIWVKAVPSASRQAVSQRITEELFPRLADWIAQFADRSNLSAQTDHRFDAFYDDRANGGTCHLTFQVDAARSIASSPRFRMKGRHRFRKNDGQLP